MSKFMNYVSFSEAMKCQKLMDFQCLASNVGQFRHVFKYFSEQPELCSTLVCGKVWNLVRTKLLCCGSKI